MHKGQDQVNIVEVYRFLNGNVHGCVFAKNRPVSLNWTDYTTPDPGYQLESPTIIERNFIKNRA